MLPRKLLPFFLHFLKPYKWYIVGMFCVSFLWSADFALSPYVLKLFVDQLTHYTGTTPLLSLLIGPIISYIGLSLGIGILFRIYDFLLMRFIPRLKRDVQHTMFTYLEAHSHTYFQNHFSGSLSNKIMDMTRGISELLQLFMNTCIDSLFGIGSVMVMMTTVNPIFALIFGIWAFIFLGASWTIAQKCQPYAKDYSEARSTTSGKIVDSISNVTNVRLFARHRFENAYLHHFTQEVMTKDIAMQKFLIKSRIFLMLSITLMITAMLFGLIWAFSKHRITAGDFVLVLTLLGHITASLWSITNQFVRFSQEVGTCQQALTLITQDHDIKDAPTATSLRVNAGKIEFKNITFRYNTISIFENLSITLHPGSKTGLVGFSGAGKTTFTNLILRIFDIESGQILIDNQDISTVTQESLHTAIAMIPQDTSLFHRSLLENIRYGRLDATDEEVIQAANLAHCDTFIHTLPKGYDSLVGERGIKLSGGQRQRIAIARAILKNAPIILLDEATSALDSVTEGHIQESLNHLMKNHTTLVIAHRLSTLAKMDRLLVFEGGKIVQDGTHIELLGQPGHYQTLWNLQANGFLPEINRNRGPQKYAYGVGCQQK